ncbi:MAG: hypothetical protein Q7U97_05315 [Rhodocyclaceae bacterium]|nr:hypothetical protein [Rhodocyclaceae bacterium]
MEHILNTLRHYTLDGAEVTKEQWAAVFGIMNELDSLPYGAIEAVAQASGTGSSAMRMKWMRFKSSRATLPAAGDEPVSGIKRKRSHAASAAGAGDDSDTAPIGSAPATAMTRVLTPPIGAGVKTYGRVPFMISGPAHYDATLNQWQHRSHVDAGTASACVDILGVLRHLAQQHENGATPSDAVLALDYNIVCMGSMAAVGSNRTILWVLYHPHRGDHGDWTFIRNRLASTDTAAIVKLRDRLRVSDSKRFKARTNCASFTIPMATAGVGGDYHFTPIGDLLVPSAGQRVDKTTDNIKLQEWALTCGAAPPPTITETKTKGVHHPAITTVGLTSPALAYLRAANSDIALKTSARAVIQSHVKGTLSRQAPTAAGASSAAATGLAQAGMRYTTEREFANSPGHFEELLPMAQLVDFIFDGTADGGEPDEVFYPMTPAQRALLVATSIQWRLGLQGEGYGSLFDMTWDIDQAETVSRLTVKLDVVCTCGDSSNSNMHKRCEEAVVLYMASKIPAQFSRSPVVISPQAITAAATAALERDGGVGGSTVLGGMRNLHIYDSTPVKWVQTNSLTEGDPINYFTDVQQLDDRQAMLDAFRDTAIILSTAAGGSPISSAAMAADVLAAGAPNTAVTVYFGHQVPLCSIMLYAWRRQLRHPERRTLLCAETYNGKGRPGGQLQVDRDLVLGEDADAAETEAYRLAALLNAANPAMNFIRSIRHLFASISMFESVTSVGIGVNVKAGFEDPDIPAFTYMSCPHVAESLNLPPTEWFTEQVSVKGGHYYKHRLSDIADKVQTFPVCGLPHGVQPYNDIPCISDDSPILRTQFYVPPLRNVPGEGQMISGKCASAGVEDMTQYVVEDDEGKPVLRVDLAKKACDTFLKVAGSATEKVKGGTSYARMEVAVICDSEISESEEQESELSNMFLYVVKEVVLQRCQVLDATQIGSYMSAVVLARQLQIKAAFNLIESCHTNGEMIQGFAALHDFTKFAATFFSGRVGNIRRVDARPITATLAQRTKFLLNTPNAALGSYIAHVLETLKL